MKSMQGNNTVSLCKAVVLTTHERSSYFSTILGDDIDMRFDSQREPALGDLLHNIIVAGGDLAIVDEAYFISPNDMALGLEHFVNFESHPERLRIIVVCSQRCPGDMLLSFLVMYCGIFNIVYGKNGVDIGTALSLMVSKDKCRADVLQLIDHGRWENVCKRLVEKSAQMKSPCPPLDESSVEETAPQEEGDLVLDVTDAKYLKINVSIKTKVSKLTDSRWKN